MTQSVAAQRTPNLREGTERWGADLISLAGSSVFARHPVARAQQVLNTRRKLLHDTGVAVDEAAVALLLQLHSPSIEVLQGRKVDHHSLRRTVLVNEMLP